MQPICDWSSRGQCWRRRQDLDSYLSGGCGWLGHQILVNAGSSDGDFGAVGREGTGASEPRRESCTGVLFRNLLNDQHLRYCRLGTGGILCGEKGIPICITRTTHR